MTIGLQLLKHTQYYWVGTERVQFKVEVTTESYFKVPVAKFIFPTKTIEVKVQPFTNLLIGIENVPFNLEFSNGSWKADLRRAI